MKRFDYETMLENHNKKAKKYLLLAIILLALFVALFLTGILISNYSNRTLIMVIFSIALSIVSIAIAIILIFGFFASQKQKKQIYYILGGYLNRVEGEVISINGPITSVNGRQGIEIVLTDNDRQKSVLYDPCFGPIPFHQGERLAVKTSESFIVQYEVLDA